MNYVPFMFVESIHEEKHKPLRTDQRRHNDGHMPPPSLMPDPIGLLCHHVLSALYRSGTWLVAAIVRTGPADHEARTHTFTVDLKRQPPARMVAKQTHTKAIPTENEKNNVTRYDARQISTGRI